MGVYIVELMVEENIIDETEE
jgi:hypothetical protein